MARATGFSKLSSNYQVVVPKPVRVALGLKPGDLFEATGILSFLAILTKMTHRPFGHEEQDGDNTRTADQRRGSETAVL